MVKKSNRRFRQTQHASQVGVGYNPQTGPQGDGGGVYMIPANQIPPQGMIIMPQVEIPNTSSSCIYYCIYLHRVLGNILRLLMRRSPLLIQMRFYLPIKIEIVSIKE